MATITKLDLRNRVLQRLGVLAAGEAGSADDAIAVEAAIDSLYGELGVYGTLPYQLSAIPEWAQDALRDCVAFRVAPTFGLPSQRLAELAASFPGAWALLTRHVAAVAPDDTRAQLRSAVLQHLAAVRPGELAPAAFAALVDDAITEVFAWYAERGSLGFDALTIPGWATGWLRDVVSFRVARSFVADQSALATYAAQAQAGVAELDKRLVALDIADTRAKLRTRILQHLGVVGLAEIATPGQRQLIDETIDNVFEQLRVHRLVTFEVTTIPAWAMLPLRDYCSYLAASSLRVDLGRMPQLKMDADQAMRELRAQQAQSQNGAAVTAVYY